MTCDLVLIGVGGQGVLTIGDLLLAAAVEAGVTGSLAPMKGMAQRGGYVQAELRLGSELHGPRVPEHGADLVVAVERSEALNGLRYARAGGAFLLYDSVWEPAGALLGSTPYPSREDVRAAIESTGASLTLLRPSDRPSLEGRPIPANIYVLGAIAAVEAIERLVPLPTIERKVAGRWPRAEIANLTALRAGFEANRREISSWEPGS